MSITEEPEWGGGSGTPEDSRRLALARGEPGVGTHREGHWPGGRHSLPGVGPTHFSTNNPLHFGSNGSRF